MCDKPRRELFWKLLQYVQAWRVEDEDDNHDEMDAAIIEEFDDEDDNPLKYWIHSNSLYDSLDPWEGLRMLRYL